jgi:hypothetical protein
MEEYKNENSYDLVFWLSSTGLVNIDYGGLREQHRLRNRIRACVSLETSESGRMSEEKKRRWNVRRKYLTRCGIPVSMSPRLSLNS